MASRRFFLILASALFLLSSCGGRGGSNSAADSSDGEEFYGQVIELSESIINDRRADTIDLGRMRQGETVVRDLMVRNASGKPMVITSLDLTCGCIEAEYPRKPLKEGEEAGMRLSFDSRGLGGWIYKTVLVYTSLTTRPYTLVVLADIY